MDAFFLNVKITEFKYTFVSALRLLNSLHMAHRMHSLECCIKKHDKSEILENSDRFSYATDLSHI